MGYVCGVMVAPPCTTWSIAFNGIGASTRSRLHPRGVPGLRGDLKRRVTEGNLLLDAGLRLLTAANKYGLQIDPNMTEV